MEDKSPVVGRAFWKSVRMLRIFAQPPDGRKVKVRITYRVPSDSLGDCDQKKDHYLIRLNKTVIENSPDAVYLILAHEWAHTLVWDNCSQDHGDGWGLAFAKCWRVICGEIGMGDLENVQLD